MAASVERILRQARNAQYWEALAIARRARDRVRSETKQRRKLKGRQRHKAASAKPLLLASS
jgi:hypothetical protein